MSLKDSLQSLPLLPRGTEVSPAPKHQVTCLPLLLLVLRAAPNQIYPAIKSFPVQKQTRTIMVYAQHYC